MRSNIALRTDWFKKALAFYAKVFGFKNRSTDPALGDFDASPLRMFIIEDPEIEGVIHEFYCG